MTAYPIRKMGDPVLDKPAERVGPPGSAGWADLPQLITDMRDSLAAAGGIGLAAPQIGVSKRVVLISVPALRFSSDQYPHGVPLTVVIDPEITVLDAAEQMGWEACLSVPELSGYVPRPSAVRLEGWGEGGQRIVWEAPDYFARVILHECDHLDGVLYPQRLHTITDLIFTSERDKRSEG